MLLIKRLGGKVGKMWEFTLPGRSLIVGSGDQTTFPVYDLTHKPLPVELLEEGFNEKLDKDCGPRISTEAKEYQKNCRLKYVNERFIDKYDFQGNVSVKDAEYCQKSIYHGGFILDDSHPSQLGRDKIRFIDVDTGAYYVMSTDELVDMIRLMGEIVYYDGAYYMYVEFQVRGGTVFMKPVKEPKDINLILTKQ